MTSWLLKEMLAKGFFPLIFGPKCGPPYFDLRSAASSRLGADTIFLQAARDLPVRKPWFPRVLERKWPRPFA